MFKCLLLCRYGERRSRQSLALTHSLPHSCSQRLALAPQLSLLSLKNSLAHSPATTLHPLELELELELSTLDSQRQVQLQLVWSPLSTRSLAKPHEKSPHTLSRGLTHARTRAWGRALLVVARVLTCSPTRTDTTRHSLTASN